MEIPLRGRFVFRGNAVGVAGRLFPVQAASSLPVIGGRSESRVGPFPDPCGRDGANLSRIVSFDAASTRATGLSIPLRKSFETEVTSTVTGLTFREVFHISVLRSSLKSVYSLNDPPDNQIPIGPPENGVQIIGLKIFDRPVKVTFDQELMSIVTMDQLRVGMAENRRWRERFLNEAEWGESCKTPEVPASGYFVYSLVEEIGWENPDEAHPDVEFDGHVVRIRNVGVISLGEVLRNANSARLTLCRAKLEYPKSYGDQGRDYSYQTSSQSEGGDGGSGESAAGEVETNGKHID